MMSIKSTEIKEAYKKARHAYTEQRRYWRNRGVELPPLPKIPKKITEASIRKIKTIAKKLGERAHTETKKAGKAKKAPAVDIVDEVYRRLEESVQKMEVRTGWSGPAMKNARAEREWQSYKLGELDKLVQEYAARRNVRQAQYILKNLKDIDMVMERLVFDRYESIEPRTGCSTECWDKLMRLIGGIDRDTGEIIWD